jgi:hypothetical protein
MKRIATILLGLLPVLAAGQSPGIRTFNVRDFGASGLMTQNAQKAIQSAIDACADAGGGMVYLPPGEYSSGTLHLKSHVRFHIESGATLYSIKLKEAFDKDALLFADGAVNITLEGRGTVHGQGAYDWRLNDHEDDFIRPNRDQMEKLGKPLMRSYPKTDQFGKLVLLLRCKDVVIRDLSFIDSPSWTIHPYACERLTIDGVYIRSSLKEGVWADGIDPDGCKDVRISNCTIETGDDALVFYSMNWFGPALPCENITVTNCRFTSSSSAIKFCDGNMNAIRNVTIDNCVITDSNRGIAFMNFDGGVVSDVVLSNLTIECKRRDWFWWGDGDPLHFNIKRRSEVHRSIRPEDDKNPAGKIQRVLIENVIARGYGSSMCNGHPDSWLEDVTMKNLRLYLEHDPNAEYDKSEHSLRFQYARNLKLEDVQISWQGSPFTKWKSALSVTDVIGLDVKDFKASSGNTGSPVIEISSSDRVSIRDSRAAEGTGTYLSVGEKVSNVTLINNDLRMSKAPIAGPGVRSVMMEPKLNLLPGK